MKRIAALALAGIAITSCGGLDSIPLPEPDTTELEPIPNGQESSAKQPEWQLDRCEQVLDEYNAGRIELSSLDMNDYNAWCEGYFIGWDGWDDHTDQYNADACGAFADIGDTDYHQWLMEQGFNDDQAVGYIDFYWKFCWGRGIHG